MPVPCFFLKLSGQFDCCSSLQKTERSTVMMNTRNSGSFSHRQMFDVVEPPAPDLSCLQKAAIRDVSFSSYLKPEESNSQVDDSEISIFDAQKYFNETGSDPRVGNRVSPVNPNSIHLDRILERCDFSSVPRYSSASSLVDGCGKNFRARSFHGAPTASSEASWNSQTGLLSNPPDAIAVSMRNPPLGDDKKRGSATKWLLGRKCPCSGKKSVRVEEKMSESRAPSRLSINSKASSSLNLKKQIPDPVDQVPIQQNQKSLSTQEWLERREVMIPNSHRISAKNSRFPSGPAGLHHRILAPAARPFSGGATATNGFTFPILSQTSKPVKLALNGLPPCTNSSPTPVDDQPRVSLEVFKPSDDPMIPTRLEADHNRRQSFAFPGSPKTRTAAAVDDDVASDASSDLFEIESFSTQTASYHPTYSSNRRDSLDEAATFNATRLTAGAGSNGGGVGLYCRRSLDDLPMTPSIAPTECYAPSEASIDWSVTTAEGFDRGSVTNLSATASEADDNMIIIRQNGTEKTNTGGCGGGGGGKRRGGGNGGGLLSCRCEKAVSVGPHPLKCVGNEGQKVVSSAMRHVSSRPGTMANKPPLARSYSARLSLPFAT